MPGVVVFGDTDHGGGPAPTAPAPLWGAAAPTGCPWSGCAGIVAHNGAGAVVGHARATAPGIGDGGGRHRPRRRHRPASAAPPGIGDGTDHGDGGTDRASAAVGHDVGVVAPMVGVCRYRRPRARPRAQAGHAVGGAGTGHDHDGGPAPTAAPHRRRPGTDRASAAVGHDVGVVAPMVGVCRHRRPRARWRAQAGHAIGGATTKTTTPGMVPGVGRSVVGDVTHAHR